MSDTRFTASNGLYVENGQVYLPDGTRANADLSSVRAVLLIEYGAHQAQAERDAELGRWRSVEHPDWVVYPETAWPEPDVVRVLHELSGIHLTYRRGHPVRNRVGSMVAREYFAAHPVPEPKPWEQAERGEVWVLTYHGEEIVVMRGVGDFAHLFAPLDDDFSISVIHDGITAGRRIWPEVFA